MSATAKLPNIDKLRGFAALSVLLYHVIEHTHWTAYPTSGLPLWGRMGWMGVDLFFVISGLVITYSAAQLHDARPHNWMYVYWQRRLARIVPLYLLTGVIFITLIQPQWLFQTAQNLAVHITTHLLFLHNLFPGTHGSINGVNWSIGVEMQFYLLICLCLPWIMKARILTVFITALLIAWSWRYAATLIIAPQQTHRLFQISTQLPGTLDEFALGIILGKILYERKYAHVVTLLKSRFSVILVTALIICVSMLTIFWKFSGFWEHSAMVVFCRTLIGASACALVVCAIFFPYKSPRYISAPLDFFGKVSYGIYLWHLPVILALKQSGAVAGYRFLLTTFAATTLLATFSYYLVEQPWVSKAKELRG